MEFKEFLQQNGVHHKFSAPYHPATNGQAERFVQIMKQSLRSMANEPGDINIKLNRFLMQYRITPHTTTKRSPSELMFGRNIRSRLNIMRSNVQQEMNQKNYNTPTKVKSYAIGQPVQIRFYNNNNHKWKFGTVVEQKGTLHYLTVVDGTEHTRHVNQMRATGYQGTNDYTDTTFIDRYDSANTNKDTSTGERSMNADLSHSSSRRSLNTSQPIIRRSLHVPPQPRERRSLSAQPHTGRQSVHPEPPPTSPGPSFMEPPAAASTPDPLRRSARVRKPPVRLNL
jgi:transposase InsO family protein